VSASVLFYFYAAIALAGALVLVTARNLVHAAMGLFATLVAIAGLYLVIGSEFLAAMQLFVYGGAITVLVLFGLMLAGPVLNRPQPPRRVVLWVAGAVSLLFFVAVAAVLWRTDWHVSPPHAHDTASIATILFSRYVLPFEIAGLSLTIALIGSVVIAREDDVLDDASQLSPPTTEGALAGDEGDAA
jgi:NADH:ubiquinone oxidoreductase subunit 6 (subunit J)